MANIFFTLFCISYFVISIAYCILNMIKNRDLPESYTTSLLFVALLTWIVYKISQWLNFSFNFIGK